MQIEWSEAEVLKSAGVGTEAEVEVINRKEVKTMADQEKGRYQLELHHRASGLPTGD
ncbi:MAG: hypothetical protein WB762_26135 [Candidatus Sulfotelmatobacter sp.]